MPQYTTRLNLYKPGGGANGTNLPDEQADIDKLNSNFDLIDIAAGATVCTSTTRPSSPFAGQIIYETDTGNIQVRSGLAWVTFVPSTSVLTSPREVTTVAATAAGTTVQFDAATQGVLYYTTAATSNFTLNVRGTSSSTLNTLLGVGQAITINFLATQGTTAYYLTAVTLDGAAQTVRWQTGTAPSAGNASSIDAYTLTIVKTAATPTYTVLASGPISFA